MIQKWEQLPQFQCCGIEGKIEEEVREGEKEDTSGRVDEGEIVVRASNGDGRAPRREKVKSRPVAPVSPLCPRVVIWTSTGISQTINHNYCQDCV
jgi:hypothetical protein